MSDGEGSRPAPRPTAPEPGSGSAREEILRRIRHALSDVPADDETPVPRSYDRSLRDEDPAALFAERAADYRATVLRTWPGEVAAAVGRTLAERAVRRVAVPADLPEEWLGGSSVEVMRDDPPLSIDQIDRVDGVVTGCALAVALTGTIVLDGGAVQGRRVLTLVPDYHLCVVRTEQIVGTVPEAVAALDPGRPLTWISGPSATSDIELTRVEGVHGPRTLDILVVAEPRPHVTPRQAV